MTISLILLAAMAAGSPSHAGERFRHHHGHHDHGRGHQGSIGGYDGLPSIVPGLGTFSGAISALRVRGNGIYFSHQGNLAVTRSQRAAPVAKIITISAGRGDAACAYEAGVCVIRP